jgi:predicted nuclease of predicted toxin-antitoxin system
MKFLANENFPLSSVDYLKNKGFDIIYIGTDNPSITDRQVLSIALKQERTILTFDRDYGELIFLYNIKPGGGVIYLRFTEFTPEEPGHIIEELVHTKGFDPNHRLTVVDKKGIRQRKY